MNKHVSIVRNILYDKTCEARFARPSQWDAFVFVTSDVSWYLHTPKCEHVCTRLRSVGIFHIEHLVVIINGSEHVI